MTASLLRVFSRLATPYSNQSTRAQNLEATLLQPRGQYAGLVAFQESSLHAIEVADHLRRQIETAREKRLPV